MESNQLIIRSLLKAAQRYSNNPFVLKSLFQHLDTLTTAQLASFYLQNDHLHCLLDIPYLDHYWQERLAQFPPFKNNFRFIKQPHLSCMEILLGCGCATLIESTPAEWQKGLLLKSFACVQRLINYRLSAIVNQELFDKHNAMTLCQILESPEVQTTLHCHQAPGYLLAAVTYFSLFACSTDKTLVNAYLLKTFEYLMRAQAIENQSQQAIHNAYFGKGMKKSNSYGIETIVGITKAVKSVAQSQKGSHDAKELEALINQAKTLSQSAPHFELPLVEPPPLLMNYAEMDAEECDEEGNTVLHLALLSHDFAKSKTLAITHPELIEKINKAELTPLSLVAEAGITIPNWLYNLLTTKHREPLSMSQPLKNRGQFAPPKIPRSQKWEHFSASMSAH